MGYSVSRESVMKKNKELSCYALGLAFLHEKEHSHKLGIDSMISHIMPKRLHSSIRRF